MNICWLLCDWTFPDVHIIVLGTLFLIYKTIYMRSEIFTNITDEQKEMSPIVVQGSLP